MLISMIVAMTEEGVIGRDQKLPWHIPEELQYFRAMTLNKPIVMGLRTFESMGSRPLPHRPNVILTHDENLVSTTCIVLHSVEAVLETLKDYDEIMIIGGASVYKQFLPLASRLYITIIHEAYKGDTYFPTVNWADWTLKDEHPRLLFTTKVYERRI
jgi:dihydrofolate reductase